MEFNQEHITYLWQRYLSKTASAAERKELFSLLSDPDKDAYHQAICHQIITAQHSTLPVDATANAVLFEAIEQQRKAGEPVQRIHFLKTTWLRYAAAMLIIIAGTLLYITNRPQKEIAVVLPIAKPDIAPGGNKATLTLADGRIIVLDSAANGTLTSQGDTKILKLDAGSLAYEASATNGEVLYNTISTPKGGQYQISLPDGTKVWLNAASSITFPTVFVKERKVTVTGELYFEVAKDRQKAFIVEVGKNATINVLGTSFNVNAYGNEENITTTLIEGSVKITSSLNIKQPTSNITLSPGQQAKLTDLQSAVINNANIDQAMAWKNGVFDFNGVKLQEVMKQLERWYDIEVVYKKGVPNITFGGKMTKGMSLSGVLIALEKSEVHFKIEGKRLIVLP